MTDEVQPTADGDTGDTATLTEDTAQTGGHDEWRARYENLQPEYTRATQRLAELEAEREQWVQAQQPEVEYDEYDDPFEQELHTLRSELDAIKQERLQEKEEREKQRAYEAEEKYVNDQVDELQKEIGRELDDDEFSLVTALAQQMRDEQKRPGVKKAYARLYDEFGSRLQKEWVKTKKAPKPGSGAAAKEQIKLDTADDRARYMSQRLDELEDS